MTRNSVVIGDVSRRILSQSTQLLQFAVTLAHIWRTAPRTRIVWSRS